jgi:hypothetical protein
MVAVVEGMDIIINISTVKTGSMDRRLKLGHFLERPKLRQLTDR